MLRATEQEFRRITVLRLVRAMEWFLHEDEARLKQTRLMCYFMANHKAQSPEDLWMTPSELRRRQIDILEGRVPIAKIRKLTPEEVANWTKNKN